MSGCTYVCGVGYVCVYVFVCNVCECGMCVFVHGDSISLLGLM